MKKTGELLKKSREEKQLSIHEIGLSLKINNKILKAIEDGDLKNLPAKTFLRGFVQSYAQYLKLNQDEILKIFTEEMGTTKPHAFQLTSAIEPAQSITVTTAPPVAATTKPVAKKETSYSAEETPVTVTSGKRFKTMTLTASVIILITLILITKRVIDKYQNEAALPAETTESIATASPQVTYVAPIEPSKQTAPTTTVTATTETEKNANSAQPTTPTPTENSFVSSATTGPSPKSALQQQAPTLPTAKPEIAKPTTPPPTTVSAANPLPTTQPTATAASTTTAAPTTTPPTSAASSTTSSKSSLSSPTTPTSSISSTTSSATSSPATSSASTPAPTPVNKAESKPAETAVAAAPQETKPAIKNIELIIEAFDAVDIEYSTTNGKNEKMRLEPEQLHTIKTKSGLKLNVSNGGAVNIIVNGKDVGVPGTLGKPVKLTF